MKKVIKLISQTGAVKGEVTVYPFEIVGYYDASVETPVLGFEEASTKGGRYRTIFRLPIGFRTMLLTSPERDSAIVQLESMGVEPSTYVLSESVHGSWKTQMHQGLCLVKEEG